MLLSNFKLALKCLCGDWSIIKMPFSWHVVLFCHHKFGFCHLRRSVSQEARRGHFGRCLDSPTPPQKKNETRVPLVFRHSSKKMNGVYNYFFENIHCYPHCFCFHASKKFQS